MVAPSVTTDPSVSMNNFVNYAIARGVKRFVVLSATPIEEGGVLAGKVHAYLRKLGDAGQIGWAALRATWFMQNLSEQAIYREPIKTRHKISTAAGDGKVPFVDAGDIANVAVRALTSATPPNTQYFVLGPDEITYADCAAVLSEELGRTITHERLTWEQRKAMFMDLGIDGTFAGALADADVGVSQGNEEGRQSDVEHVMGVKPRGFRDFARESRGVWAM